MKPALEPALPSAYTGAPFTTPHWSVVLAAGQPVLPQIQAALESLCRTYW